MNIAIYIAEEIMVKTSNWETSTDRETSTDNVISLYLKEINKIPLLGREEENTLARQAATGDKTAKDKLVQANLRFVVNVAKKYRNQGMSLEDLISEGNIGLMNAVERYDVEKGFHFISYAVWWIRQAILKAICEKSRMIRLPLNRANELVQIEKARKTLQGPKAEREEIEEIAALLNMDGAHVADLVNIARDHASLEAPIGSDRDATTLGEFLEDSHNPRPEDLAVETNLKEDINVVLNSLSEKESSIIQFRFGLNGQAPMSLKEIGDRYKLTKERIRQIEKKAIKRIQHPARSRLLEAYIA